MQYAVVPRVRPSFTQCLSLAALLLALDQLSKWWIVQRFPELGMGEVVFSFLNLVRVHNAGAAFSFLSDAGGWQRYFFLLLALGVAVVLILLLRKPQGNVFQRLGLSLVLAGALGNAIDRLVYGYVIDFLDFHWSFLSPLFYAGHYPAFNIADACITLGVVCFVWGELRKPEASTSAKK